MADIDAEVAAFATQLQGLTAIDAEQVAVDVGTLVTAIMSAPNHVRAAAAVREFHDAHSADATYAIYVILGALSSISMHIALVAPSHEIVGDDGLLQRFYRVGMAARAVGLALGAVHP